MLAIILVSLVVIGCIIWGILESEVFMGFVMAFFFGIITLFLSVVLACTIGIFPEKVETFERKNIVALQDNNSIKGSFFLFSGQIDGVSYYHYMEQKDGYKVANKIGVDNARIYEDGENFIEECKIEFKNRNWDEWAGIWDKTCDSRIHIPKDSITNEFNIDLK